MTTTNRASDSMLADMMLGAVAGVAAVWVMTRVDQMMFDREPAQARLQTQSVRPLGASPAHVIAHKAADAMGKQLSNPRDNAAGKAIHYALGTAPAMLYGMFRDRYPVLSKGRGALFGIGMFVMQDEALNPLLGLSARPREYPWQAHARGLVSHVVYGLVLEASLNALKRAKRSAASRTSAVGTTTVETSESFAATASIDSSQPDLPLPPRTQTGPGLGASTATR